MKREILCASCRPKPFFVTPDTEEETSSRNEILELRARIAVLEQHERLAAKNAIEWMQIVGELHQQNAELEAECIRLKQANETLFGSLNAYAQGEENARRKLNELEQYSAALSRLRMLLDVHPETPALDVVKIIRQQLGRQQMGSTLALRAQRDALVAAAIEATDCTHTCMSCRNGLEMAIGQASGGEEKPCVQDEARKYVLPTVSIDAADEASR